MSWYSTLGKAAFEAGKKIVENKTVQGAVGTVGTAWLMEKFIHEPKEKKKTQSQMESVIKELKEEIERLKKKG